MRTAVIFSRFYSGSILSSKTFILVGIRSIIAGKLEKFCALWHNLSRKFYSGGLIDLRWFQLMNLKKEAGWAVVRLAHMIREEAAFIAGEHRREPCPGCGPMFPPFLHHGFGFGPEIPRRGPHFPRDDDEPFRQNGPFRRNGPFQKDGRFEHNELPGQHGLPRRYTRWAALRLFENVMKNRKKTTVKTKCKSNKFSVQF